jgi:hypothetical protein
MIRKKELCYGNDPLQRVDVYQSFDVDSEECFAENMLLYIHGGLWMNGDKKEYEYLARLLARDGWSVCVVNYRLSDPEKNSVKAPQHTQVFLFVKEPNNNECMTQGCCKLLVVFAGEVATGAIRCLGTQLRRSHGRADCGRTGVAREGRKNTAEAGVGCWRAEHLQHEAVRARVRRVERRGREIARLRNNF